MKTLVNPRRRIGRLFFACASALALLPTQLLGHTCPADATATGVGVTVAALRTNGAPVGTGFVAPCEPIIIQMSIVYFPLDPITGGKNAAFQDGQMFLNVRGVVSNVTPLGGVPLIGGDATVGCDGLNFFRSLQLPYTVTEADAAAGTIPILAIYTNGTAHLSANNLPGVVSGTQGFVVNVRPGVTCSIVPATNVICQGGSATFTASAANGTAPYTFQWRGPNNFITNGPTITINNAQPANAGVYTATVTDFYGCTNVCTALLVVRPAPTCSISGPTNVCHPSTNTYTATVNPPTPGATFSWTVTGQGQIVGPNNQASVQVRTTGSGSYTINNVVSVDGCSNTCSRTVTVRICDVRISLTKEIVCWTPNGCAPFTGSDVAVGARSGNQCPAFCYRITVQNVSDPAVEIRNLVVQDNRLNLAGCNFPSTLAPAGTAGSTFSCIVSNVTHCDNTVNTVTVNGSGFDIVTGGLVGPVSTNDTARAVVVPISITCEKMVSSPDDTDPGPAVVLPGDGMAHPVTYGLRVANPSTLPLIVQITDPALQNCPLPSEFATGVAIPAGQMVTYSNICTAMLQCGVEPLLRGLTNTVFVRAVVDTLRTNVCAFTSNGVQVAASNNCSAVVVQPAPSCSISGPTNVCHLSTNTYTATVNPPSPGAIFRWTVTGQGQIVGPNNQATVQVRTTGSGSYTVNNVVGTGSCTNSCSRTVTVRICEVRISLVKEVVCWTPDGCAPFTGADTAVGIRSQNQCPAFCYRITVQNVSPPGVEIRNLVVQDNRLNLAGCNFPTTLAPAGAPGSSFSCIISNVTHCENVANTVTVNGSGFDVVTGGLVGSVNTNDTARVVIVPISIVCEKTVSSPDDTDPGPAVLLPADGLPHAVTYGLTVENPSTLPLVVHISDPALQNCPLPPEFTSGVAIPAGQSVTWSNICTAMLQCGAEPLLGGLTNTVFVTAVVDTSVTNVCPFASDGALVTASNDCSAVVECPTGAGCTPGFWKNCTIHWQPTGYTLGQPLSSVFRFNGCCSELRNVSLRQALDFGGGDGVCGAARILLRAAVAALLNASSPEVDYPFTRDQVIAQVNAALATCKRGPILALAGELDRNNNLGCRDSRGNSLPCKRLTTP